MKKYLFMLLSLLPLAGVAATPALTVEGFGIKAGEEKAMVIGLNNPQDEITLVQFDLRLPSGLNIKKVDGDYDIDIAGRTTWKKHSLDANAQSDGSIRFLLASSSNTVLSGTSGAVITVTLVADGSFSGGDVRLENILMVTPEEKEYEQPALTCAVGGSTPTPPAAGTAKLAIEPFTIAKGGEAEMLVDVVNPDNEVTLVQFDLKLPAGLSIRQTGGEYDIDIAGRTTWKKHSLDANALTDGIVRFLLASSSNAALSGTSGAVIKVPLSATSSFSGGTVTLSNILIVSPDEAESTPSAYSYTVPAPSTPVTVTAKSYTRVYGEANPTFEYTATGGTLNGKPAVSCEATAKSPVGTYPIVVKQGSVTGGDVTYVNGTLTVTKAPLTVSGGTYTMKQGDPLPTFKPTYSGFKNGETESVLTKKPTLTTTATSSSPVGDYTVTVSGAEAQNYTFSYVNGTLTVTKADPKPGTAKLAIEPFTIAKGGEAEMLVDVTNPDNEVTLVQFDMKLPAGLSIRQTGGEYDIDIAGRTTWKKHSLDANALTDGSIRFLLASSSNAALSGTSGAVIKVTLSATSSFSGGTVTLNNILIVSPDEAESTPSAYSYEVKVKDEKPAGIAIDATNFPDANFRNYLLSQDYGKDGVLTEGETQKVTSINVSEKDISSLKGIEYFTALKTLYCSRNQLTSLDVSKNTALTSLLCSFNQLTALDVSKNTALTYLSCYSNQLTSLDVSKNTALTGLTFYVNMIKGTAMDALIASLPKKTTSNQYRFCLHDTSVKNEGNVCTKAQVAAVKAKGWFPCYYDDKTWKYVEYEGSGEEQPVTVTAKSYTRVYGEANPTFEYTVTGGTLNGKPAVSCEATAKSPVGTYPIVVKQGSVTGGDVTYVNGTLTVTKAPLTVSGGTYTMKQGDPLPTFKPAYSGFKNGETESVLTKKPTLTTTATSASSPGTYDVVISGAEAQNYTINYVKGTLTVTQADPVTVTAKSYTREYGDANPTFGYTSTGATLSGKPEITCSATKTSPVGTYPIVIKKGGVTNYNDSYVNGTLTIIKAPLTAKALDVTVEQGKTIPQFTIVYEGWKNGENESVLQVKPSAITAT